MKYIKISLGLLIFIFSLAFQQRVEAQYVLSNSVLGNGGTVISNSSYIVGCTVGQPLIGVSGNTSYINKVGFWYLSTGFFTSLEQPSIGLPTKYWLEQNFPNPFNPTTTIRFMLPKTSQVTLKLFDMLGRNVVTLVDKKLQVGEHKVVFNAQGLSSGVYFYRIHTDGFVKTKKLILTK